MGNSFSQDDMGREVDENLTNGEMMRALAAEKGIPVRTLQQVQAAIADAATRQCAGSLARLMLRHGRMTDEARAWLAQNGETGEDHSVYR